jgi:hypothetical protein
LRLVSHWPVASDLIDFPFRTPSPLGGHDRQSVEHLVVWPISEVRVDLRCFVRCPKPSPAADRFSTSFDVDFVVGCYSFIIVQILPLLLLMFVILSSTLLCPVCTSMLLPFYLELRVDQRSFGRLIRPLLAVDRLSILLLFVVSLLVFGCHPRPSSPSIVCSQCSHWSPALPGQS